MLFRYFILFFRPGVFYKIMTAFGAMDADLPVISRNTDLLFTAGTVKNSVFTPFLQLKMPFFQTFFCPKMQAEIGVIFLTAPGNVSGKNPKIKEYQQDDEHTADQ